MIPQPPRSTLFSYTTLFLSLGQQRINSQDQCPDRITTIVACCSIDDCRCAIEYMTQPCERQLICTYTEVIGLAQQRLNSHDQCPDRITTIVACCSIDDCRCAIEYMTQPCEFL